MVHAGIAPATATDTSEPFLSRMRLPGITANHLPGPSPVCSGRSMTDNEHVPPIRPSSAARHRYATDTMWATVSYHSSRTGYANGEVKPRSLGELCDGQSGDARSDQIQVTNLGVSDAGCLLVRVVGGVTVLRRRKNQLKMKTINDRRISIYYRQGYHRSTGHQRSHDASNRSTRRFRRCHRWFINLLKTART